jgi:hypothetical protein
MSFSFGFEFVLKNNEKLDAQIMPTTIHELISLHHAFG